MWSILPAWANLPTLYGYRNWALYVCVIFDQTTKLIFYENIYIWSLSQVLSNLFIFKGYFSIFKDFLPMPLMGMHWLIYSHSGLGASPIRLGPPLKKVVDPC